MSVVKVCLATLLLRQLHLVSASAADCPGFTAGSFPAAAARRHISCSHPASIKAVPQSVGHISLNNIDMLSSSGTTCGTESEELKVFVKKTGQGSMTLGTADCTLQNVVVTKSDDTPAATAQLRLDFEDCTGGPSSASVLADVVALPDATATTSMMPFWRQACGVQTTTPAQSLGQLKLYFSEAQVGNSTCSGSELASYPNVDKNTCKQLCIADVQKFGSSLKSLTTSPEMCRGYTFNKNGAAGSNVCTLYKGKFVADLTGPVGTHCWNLTVQGSQFHESTAAPPSAAAVMEMKSKLPKLNITLTPNSANILTFESTDACFQPFNWITLQNYNAATFALTTATVNVMQSEWEEFLALIPASSRRLEKAKDLRTSVLADRATYGLPGIQATATSAPLPDCKAPPAEAASMTMTWVLATVLVFSAVGCFFANHGSPQSSVAPQDPAAKPFIAPPSNDSNFNSASQAPAGAGPAGPGMSTSGPSGPGGMMSNNAAGPSGPGGMMSTNAGPTGPGMMSTMGNTQSSGITGPSMGARPM